ncbi:A/G-specific adenine glycosylase [Myxosarcina sp. GI1]|uniref:A/G-specific adenine glycosylase n=1 Tax=Myxosarcina sp. GI1 TaxID=1541065 RepID=UPI0009DEBBE1|nr:A/G-specific adenine glycosylase [Myxosarcina sp. GI1]
MNNAIALGALASPIAKKNTNSIASREQQINELLVPEKVSWYRRKLLAWQKTNLRDFPWRQTKNPYQILVAEFLLQRTDAVTVLPLYEDFLRRYPTLEILSQAKVTEIENFLQPLGLFFRASRLHETANIIANEGGKVPNSEIQLLKLPGIGKYTARAICACAFNQPLAVLDTNVARILERFFGLQGERVKSRCKLLWQAAELTAPQRKVGRWNLTLLDFGAKVCTARKPACSNCPLAKKCNWYASIHRL